MSEIPRKTFFSDALPIPPDSFWMNVILSYVWFFSFKNLNRIAAIVGPVIVFSAIALFILLDLAIEKSAYVFVKQVMFLLLVASPILILYFFL